MAVGTIFLRLRNAWNATFLVSLLAAQRQSRPVSICFRHRVSCDAFVLSAWRLFAFRASRDTKATKARAECVFWGLIRVCVSLVGA